MICLLPLPECAWNPTSQIENISQFILIKSSRFAQISHALKYTEIDLIRDLDSANKNFGALGHHSSQHLVKQNILLSGTDATRCRHLWSIRLWNIKVEMAGKIGYLVCRYQCDDESIIWGRFVEQDVFLILPRMYLARVVNICYGWKLCWAYSGGFATM